MSYGIELTVRIIGLSIVIILFILGKVTDYKIDLEERTP